jgi:glycosyltransferase involved in cell wall biosynthesis
MPRILHLIDSLISNGAAAQLQALQPGLAQQGFETHVAVLDDPAPAVSNKGTWNSLTGMPTAPFTALQRRWVFDPIALFRLEHFMRKLRADIVHTWTFDAALFAGMAMAKWRAALRAKRGRVVALPKLIVGLYRIEQWKAEWQWALLRRIAGGATRLVTNSQNIRDWYVAKGLPAEKFSIIPAGVPASRPSDVTRDQLLRELNLPPDARLIGVVGRLVPEKRVKDLIWSADLLRVLHDSLRLLVIGDGPLRVQLEEYARKASDVDHIRFLGQRSDVWRIMPHLEVLWYGSENISQSFTILEAMAASVPVVASDTPTNRELVVENETGYLIPLGTRAGRAARARLTDGIFKDAALGASLGEAVCHHATKQFNAVRMVQCYSTNYSGVVDEVLKYVEPYRDQQAK